MFLSPIFSTSAIYNKIKNICTDPKKEKKQRLDRMHKLSIKSIPPAKQEALKALNKRTTQHFKPSK